MSIYLQGSLAYGREAKIGPFRAAKMLVNTILALHRSDYMYFRNKGMQIVCVCVCVCVCVHVSVWVHEAPLLFCYLIILEVSW